MATKLRFPDDSFRMGAGRYLQDNGVISFLGQEIIRLGRCKPFVMGGKTALELTRSKIEIALSESGMTAPFYRYDGFCNKETCSELMESEEFKSSDIVVGVGGGNIMDAAKYCAVVSGKPIINIPTSSATCAAYTPLSVCYDSEGRTVGTVHHKTEVNCVLADMDILFKQPVRLLIAGVYDSLAKQYELYQRMMGVDEKDTDIGLLSSYKMSNFICDYLTANMEEAIRDIQNGVDSKTVYDVVYICIALTGVVSGLARGSNQTAIAHKIYEALRRLYPAEVYNWLHGEMVALGLIVQIAFNGEGGEDEFSQRLKSHGIPTTLSQLKVNDDKREQKLAEKILESSAMAGTNDEEKARFKDVLKLII